MRSSQNKFSMARERLGDGRRRCWRDGCRASHEGVCVLRSLNLILEAVEELLKSTRFFRFDFVA